MSSRGFFLGKIIDDLDAISSQVKQRCKLQQTDLNRVLEDFFKELLNLVYNVNLRNLNKDRVNEPGLDLGDATSPYKIAFQITSQTGASKINKTLEKVTQEHLSTYDKIFVFVIGKRQKTYSLNTELTKKCSFSEKNIIGITEICRKIMDLDVETIRSIQVKLAEEQRRIRIELEPEIDGKFETNISDLIESRPSVKRSDASILANHESTEGLFASVSEAAAALNGFIDQLQKLPRMAREFFGWLIDNSEQRLGLGSCGSQVNADYVEKVHKDSLSLMADIRLLTAWGFIDHDQDESHKSGYFRIFFPGGGNTVLLKAFMYLVDHEQLSVSSMFATMNFTPFGPIPPAQPSKNKSKGKVLKASITNKPRAKIQR